MCLSALFALLIPITLMASESTSESNVIALDQKPRVDIQCFSTVYPKYHTLQYGNPYMIQIKNVSTLPIIVHPSIIQDIMPKEPIVEALKMKSCVGVSALFGITALSGLWTRFLFKVADNVGPNILLNPVNEQAIADYALAHQGESFTVMCDNTRTWAKLSLAVTIFGAAATALCYWNYCTIEADLDQNLLHAPIVLQPGEEVRKYFWLQPAAGIKFDLGEVEAL